MNVEITKMTLNDLDTISNILNSKFDDFWSYSVLKSELESQSSIYIVAKIKNKIVGFAGIKIIVDEADIMNIVVRKDFRNIGIGTLLLENLINLSKDLDLNLITLEVNEKNSSAIHLYENFGFEQVGIRKNYYKNINGLIMTKKLT